MFYVKVRGRKVNIREDNVFTRCPECAEKDGNAILGRE